MNVRNHFSGRGLRKKHSFPHPAAGNELAAGETDNQP